MLDVHRLRVLCEVARTGSMTAAAEALRYSQPAVSHHIKRLEAETGTPLVIRHARGVRLTEAGRLLAAHAEAVLVRLAGAEEELAAVAGLRTGRVRVAAFPSAVAGLLPDALAALRRRAPGVRVALSAAEPPEALAALRAGEADLAVVFRYGAQDAGPADPADAWLREVPLFDEPVRVLVSRAHPLAGRERVELSALSGDLWAAGCERCRGNLERACAAAGFAPDIAYATDDHVAVQRLVARDLAVTALPMLALRLHDEPDVVRLRAAGIGPRSVSAVLAAGFAPPAVAALAAELAAVAARPAVGP